MMLICEKKSYKKEIVVISLILVLPFSLRTAVSLLNYGYYGVRIVNDRTDGFYSKIAEDLNAISQTRDGVYLDKHNWVFEPNSLKDIIQKLKLLKYINLEIKEISGTVSHEFFARLFKK